MADRVYLLSGPDALLADTLGSLIATLREEGLDIEELNDDELTAGSIVEACGAPFLFGSGKAVIVREAERFRVADDVKRLAGYIADPDPVNTLVLVLGGEAKAFVTAARKAGATVIDCGAPSRPRDRAAWIAERAAASGLRLERAALNRLADHLGEDVGRLPAMLDVLEARHGEGARIADDDLDPVLGDAGASAPWDLTDAIDRGDVEGSLVHLRRALTDRHPLVVLASLWNHFQRMVRLDGSGARTDQDAAALLSLRGSTFPAKKALAQTDRLGSHGVASAVAMIHRADLDLRGLRDLPDTVVLELLVARLARLARTAQRRR